MPPTTECDVPAAGHASLGIAPGAQQADARVDIERRFDRSEMS